MISVIIPIFNENLQQRIAEVDQALIGYDREIIVVNDNPKRLFDSSPLFRLVSHAENMGKGAAFRTGYRNSKGSLILLIDADQQIAVKELDVFMRLMTLYNADAVIGNKRHIYSTVNYPLLRRIVSGGYRLIVKALFNYPITDTQVGFKLFKRSALEKVMPKLLVKRFAFDIELLTAMKAQGLRVIDAPIKMNKPQGQGSVSWRNIYDVFKDTLAVWYRHNIRRHYADS